MTIHFDHTIIKLDQDGNRQASSYLAPGEKLENGQTYEEVQGIYGIEPATDVHVVGDDEGNQGQGLTVDSTGTSTVAENPSTPSNTGDEDQPPAKSALKDEWFAYAQKHGYDGEEDDITKEQLIEQYGPKED